MTDATAQTDKTEPPRQGTSHLTRAEFLNLAWKGLLGLSSALGTVGLWHFLSYQADPAPPTAFDLGLASDFPVGGKAVIEEARAVVFHHPDGFVAYSLVCPHLGCTVEPKGKEFICPCHGSRFAEDGSRLRGPADKSLRAVQIQVDELGHLVLNTKQDPG